MTKEDLSFVADALLSLAEVDEKAPCYTEEKLRAKIRRDHDWCASCAQEAADHTGAEVILEHEFRDVLHRAKLTASQLEVLTLRFEGKTFDQIGRARGHSKQAAQHIFIYALKKLCTSHNVYPYSGLSDVYRNEVRRGVSQAFGTMHR